MTEHFDHVTERRSPRSTEMRDAIGDSLRQLLHVVMTAAAGGLIAWLVTLGSIYPRMAAVEQRQLIVERRQKAGLQLTIAIALRSGVDTSFVRQLVGYASIESADGEALTPGRK